MNLEGIRQIGKIFNSHGVKGEMKVAPYTSYPEIFHDLKEIFLIEGGERTAYRLESAREVKDHWLFRLEGVEDLDGAKRLRNVSIYAEEKELKPLAEDEFRVSDLMKNRVFSTDGEYLGVVENYFENGEHGICEVRDENGSFLFPTTKEVLKEIIPEEKIIIQLLPELRDLNR